MEPIRLNVYIHAPIEDVFDALTDHEGYASYPGVGSAKLLTPGDTERNGLGARREIRALGARFVEDITRFERPTRMDYLIRECSLPIRHLGGSMTFTRRGEGTEVDWKSSVEPALPVGGRVFSTLMRPLTIEGFTRFLLAAKERLEHRAAKKATLGISTADRPSA